MLLTGEEAPLFEPFWVFQDASEETVVRAVLRRRFPEAFAVLGDSLTEADPMDVVYPGNPGEYDDVVCEILVLLAGENAGIGLLDRSRTEQVIREGLGRRFGEEPDEERLARAVSLVRERAATDGDRP